MIAIVKQSGTPFCRLPYNVAGVAGLRTLSRSVSSRATRRTDCKHTDLPPSTTSRSSWKNWLITVCLCAESASIHPCKADSIASRNKSRVKACGFDSVPSSTGALLTRAESAPGQLARRSRADAPGTSPLFFVAHTPESCKPRTAVTVEVRSGTVGSVSCDTYASYAASWLTSDRAWYATSPFTAVIDIFVDGVVVGLGLTRRTETRATSRDCCSDLLFSDLRPDRPKIRPSARLANYVINQPRGYHK